MLGGRSPAQFPHVGWDTAQGLGQAYHLLSNSHFLKGAQSVILTKGLNGQMRRLCMRHQLGLIPAVVFGLVFSWLIFEKGRFVLRELQINLASEQTALFDEMMARRLRLGMRTS